MNSFHGVVDTHPSRPQPSPYSTHSHLRSPSPEPPPPRNTLNPIPEPLNADSGSGPEVGLVIWEKAWQAWHSIGIEFVCRRLPSAKLLGSLLREQKLEEIDDAIPSQRFLDHLLRIFPLVFSRLKSKFSQVDYHTLSRVVHAALLMPISKDVSPFLVPSANENVLSVVQRLALECHMGVLTNEPIFSVNGVSEQHTLLPSKQSSVVDLQSPLRLTSGAADLVALCPAVLDELFRCSRLASDPPDLVRMTQGVAPTQLSVMATNFAPFSVAATSLAVKLYRACMEDDMALPSDVPERFLKVCACTRCRVYCLIPLHTTHALIDLGASLREVQHTLVCVERADSACPWV